MDGAGSLAAPVRSVIGTAIRRLRAKDGLTLEELASRAGISYQHLSEIETGKQNFSISVLERISSALDASLDALFTTAYARSE